MPLTEDDNETFPVGIGVSLNSTLKVTEGLYLYFSSIQLHIF